MQTTNINSESFPIHVAIVESDPTFLDALSKVVQAAPDMRLTGVAGSRAAGLALLNGAPADVLLIDLGLPDGSGIDVIRAGARKWAGCNIMVRTSFVDETHVMRSIKAGATGYLLKDSPVAGMVEEIRSLASGGSPISPIIARQILTHFRQGGTRRAAGKELAAASSSLLSVREKEVLGFITKGFTTKEIAKLLQLSQFTVRTFVRRIYSKLKVTSKAEAIFEARTLGLVAD
ncbi:response regulator transcription factor [Paraburkholderia fungorum]|uniref:DNA-binding response regulator n=1 Tax=Paraburkholderia fungorum TaxID=134537 RepID=A0A3R7ETB4_9BURK|nr:response regulator transcription factor [Paraburkholderia fungorum]RKF46721.1 DNA-binding response regulator [Paraburkholderia fungorum]